LLWPRFWPRNLMLKKRHQLKHWIMIRNLKVTLLITLIFTACKNESKAEFSQKNTFQVEIENTLSQLLEQEDTDGDKKITIEDDGSKSFELTSEEK